MDRGAWWATVQETEQNQIQLKRISKHACIADLQC